MPGDEQPQDPTRFGIGRLFWLTTDAIVAADVATERIVLWNDAAAAMFGYTAAEALGAPLEMLVPEDLRGQHLAGIRRYRETGRRVLVGTGRVSVQGLAKSGDLLDVVLSLTDVSTPDLGPCVLAIIRDETEQRRAERELAATHDAMRDFMAAASHDLRTPLAAVLGHAELLRDHGDEWTSDKRLTSLNAIMRAVDRAGLLVNDLLTLSQIEAGSIPVQARPTAVAEVCRNAVELAGAPVPVGVDDGLVALVDPERMVVNLVTNAARYGAEPVTVTGSIEDDAVVVTVTDSGPGVPEDFVPRLFTRFARADALHGPGTGLGLAIVQGLARVNGGEAFYRSPVAGGACFGVRLPVAR